MGLAASGSDQVQKAHSGAEARGFHKLYNLDLVATASAISGQGLLGSPPPREPAKRGAPAAHLNSVAEFFQIHSRGPLSRRDATSDWLAGALEELDQVDEEAAEEGLPLSNQLCKRNARNILKKLAQGTTPAPTVYATDNGAIAILFQNRETQSGVLILCEPDGSGACFSTTAGKKRRARYDDASDLPDAFVTSQLEMLPFV